MAALRQVLAATPDDLQLVLEPLNTVLDHPGYRLADMETAAAIVREGGERPAQGALRPLPHGDDGPAPGAARRRVRGGRHEPGTGAIDWLAVLRRLRDRGYAGFEYFPAGDPEASLCAVRRLWDAL